MKVKNQPMSKETRTKLHSLAKQSVQKYADLLEFYNLFYILYVSIYADDIENAIIRVATGIAMDYPKDSRFTFKQYYRTYLYTSSRAVYKPNSEVGVTNERLL